MSNDELYVDRLRWSYRPLWPKLYTSMCPVDYLEGSDLSKAEVFLMFLVLPHILCGQVVALVTKSGQCFLFSDNALWASACV